MNNVTQSSPYMHNLGSGGLGEGHLGMLSAEVPLQLALGGEELIHEGAIFCVKCWLVTWLCRAPGSRRP